MNQKPDRQKTIYKINLTLKQLIEKVIALKIPYTYFRLY